MTDTDRKVFSRAFRSYWDHENQWRIDGDMAKWSLWHRPLFDLTCSDKTWTWDTKEQKAFECLKMVVTTAPVLVLPQDSEPFCIKADSSDFASGVVLS